MDPTEDYSLLIEWLKERKMSDGEIQLVLDKVRMYDEKTMHDSVMDSIGSGRMTLDALIKDALDN
jgi:hypothetical protein